jgi:hypothetical protein
MPIRVTCAKCAASYLIPAEHAGKLIRCKKCQQPVRVPDQPGGKKVNPGMVLLVVLVGLAAAIPVAVILLGQSGGATTKHEPGEQLAADAPAPGKQPAGEQPKPADRQPETKPARPAVKPPPRDPGPAGPAYALKVKRHPDVGRVVVVRKVSSESGFTKYFDDRGKLVREDRPEDVREETYSLTVLETAPGARLPHKFRRSYDKALLRSGDKTTPLPYQGRSVLFELRDGNYQAAAEGQPPLSAADLARLADDAASDPLDNFFPGRPVKVGETWTVDPRALTGLLGKAAVENGAHGEGKLVRVYEKDGQQFGVLEWTLRLSLQSLGVLAFSPPGLHETTLVLDTAIDGSGTAALLTANSRLSGRAGFEEMGKKLSAEIALTPSLREESSAEANPPPGREAPPAVAANDTWELFTSQEGRFSARFPVKPTAGEQKNPDGTTTHGFTAVTADHSNFIVTYLDAPRPGAFRPKEYLDGLAAHYAADTKSKRALELNGYPGLELVLETQSNGVSTATTLRAYLVKDRFYQVLAAARRDLKDQEGFGKFLDSFALLDQPQAVVVKPPDTPKPADPVKPPAPPKPPEPAKPGASGKTQAELRAAAVAWFKDNHAMGPTSPFLATIKPYLEKNVTDQTGFLLKIRPRVVKSGKTTVLAGWDGDFFVFEASPEQAKTLGLLPEDVGLVTLPYPEQVRKPRQFTLSALKVDNADKLDPAKQMTGSVACKRVAAGEAKNLALRLTQAGPKGATFTAVSPLPEGAGKDGGTLTFTFPDLTMFPDKMAGTSVAFVELVSFPDEERQGEPTVLSNPVATLITVVAGKEEKK